MTDSANPFRRIRRTQYTLLLLMAALGAAGVLADSLWLLGSPPGH